MTTRKSTAVLRVTSPVVLVAPPSKLVSIEPGFPPFPLLIGTRCNGTPKSSPLRGGGGRGGGSSPASAPAMAHSRQGRPLTPYLFFLPYFLRVNISRTTDKKSSRSRPLGPKGDALAPIGAGGPPVSTGKLPPVESKKQQQVRMASLGWQGFTRCLEQRFRVLQGLLF